MKFTVFCTDDSENGTTWISAVEAETPYEAAKLGRNQCADEWGYARDDVTVVGVALGDIDIIGWDDNDCLTHFPKFYKNWTPPQPEKIWVARIDHRHGSNTYVGKTEADVRSQLEEYVRDEVQILGRTGEVTVDDYFDAVEDEFLEIDSHLL